MSSPYRYSLAALVAAGLSGASYWMALHPVDVYWTGLQALGGMIGYAAVAGICAASALIPSIERALTLTLVNIWTFAKATAARLLAWVKSHERPIVPTSNNFDPLRLLCCVMVVCGHSFNITGNGDRDPLYRLTGGMLDDATTGLLGFFAISGFLITSSYLGDPHLLRFLWKRVLRIYPAFLVIGALCLFVLAPWSCETAEGKAKLLHWMQSPNNHIVAQLFRLDIPTGTPATFPHTFAKSHALNGPPWTLAVEFSLYLAIGAMGVMGLLKRNRAMIAVWIGFLAIHAYTFYGFGKWHNDLWYPAGPAKVVIPLWMAFMTGALCRILPPLRGWPMAVIAFAFWFHDPTEFTKNIAWPVIIIWTGNHVSRLPKIRYDLSYGLYLVAWPLQQIGFSYFTHSSIVDFIFTMTLGLPIAYASWILVERPALSLKGIRLPHIHKTPAAGGKELGVDNAPSGADEHPVRVIV